jgi:nitrous oxidase accessory protein NosD
MSYNCTNIEISQNSYYNCWSGIYLIETSQIEIEHNKFETNMEYSGDTAICGDFTFDVKISNNIISNFTTAIWIDMFNNVIIENNMICEGKTGIYLSSGLHTVRIGGPTLPKGAVQISNNSVSNIIYELEGPWTFKGAGIKIEHVETIEILNNIINNCSVGMDCWNIGNLTVFRNSIFKNGRYALRLVDIEIGQYYLNLIGGNEKGNVNLVDTIQNVGNWDNGTVGNYWSDYLEKCPDAVQLEGKIIWDTSYPIGEGNYDNFPLVNPSWDLVPESASFSILGYPTWIILLSLGVIIGIIPSRKRM